MIRRSFILLFGLCSAAAVADGVSLDDYSALKTLYSAELSNDGQQIAYVVDGKLYLMNADGSFPRAISASSSRVWGQRWSNDGESIYFLSDRDEGPQIYQLPVKAGGEATQLTHFKNGVASINFSPAKSRVLLEISDNERVPVEEDAEPKPFVITRRLFKQDAGDGYIVDGDSKHLYVYDIETQQVRQLTSGAYEESEPVWSPDGASVVFVSNREADPDATHRTDLWLVDSRAENAEPKRITDSPRPKFSPAISPDGGQVAYLSANDGVYGIYNLTVVPIEGGEPRILTEELDRWVASFQYSEDGKWIYFNYYNEGAVNYARVRVRDSKIDVLLDGNQVIHWFDVNEAGETIAIANTENNSTNIYRIRRNSLKRLSNLNKAFFDAKDIGNKTKVRFTSEDGIELDTFITTPPDYKAGQTYPTILHIHGGPQSQFSWGYDFTVQYYAAKGYVVVEPNPRGSLGRGEAFLRTIYRAWGVPDYDDVIAAVDHAIALGISDPERLAVTGFSYGGYMTNVVITETNRFKAAASGAGHSLIEANVGHDIYQRWYFWELGKPWEQRERYDVHSPLLRVGQVTTPTLFLGGQIDWNVPILNAELFYQALKVQGVDTTLVVYPGAHHGGWPESFEKDYLRRVSDWFDRYLMQKTQ